MDYDSALLWDEELSHRERPEHSNGAVSPSLESNDSSLLKPQQDSSFSASSYVGTPRKLQVDQGGQGSCPSSSQKTFTVQGGRPQDLRDYWQCALSHPGLVTINVAGKSAQKDVEHFN